MQKWRYVTHIIQFAKQIHVKTIYLLSFVRVPRNKVQKRQKLWLSVLKMSPADVVASHERY